MHVLTTMECVTSASFSDTRQIGLWATVTDTREQIRY